MNCFSLTNLFCDISKAFDKVWHKGIIFKLNKYGIKGPLLRWFESYLENRIQKVVINGYKSDGKPVLAGVPQGSVLGPLLFIIYINDIVDGINCNIRLFADDTSIYVIIDDHTIAVDHRNSDLNRISNWANTWQVNFNPNKTETVLFTRKFNTNPKPTLDMNDTPVQEVNNHKHLGLTLQDDCSWSIYFNEIVNKVSPMINCL